MRIVLETRARRKLPRLKEVMDVYRKERSYSPEENLFDAKINFASKLRKLYSNDDE